MKAVRGVLLTCDVAVKQILLAKNQEQNFVIEDLDDHHLLIKADEEVRIRRMLETEVKFFPKAFTAAVDDKLQLEKNTYSLESRDDTR